MGEGKQKKEKNIISSENNTSQKSRNKENIERVLAFDRAMKEVDDYRFFGAKVLYILFGIIGCLVMTIPCGQGKETGMFGTISVLFLGFAVIFRLQPYLQIGQQPVRLTAILAYTPVDKAAFRQVRCGYLRHFLVRVWIIVFVLQQFGSIIDKSWSFRSILYPAAVMAVVSLIGICYIGRS